MLHFMNSPKSHRSSGEGHQHSQLLAGSSIGLCRQFGQLIIWRCALQSLIHRKIKPILGPGCLHIVATASLEEDEIWVAYSDGTAAIFEADELEKLRPSPKLTLPDHKRIGIGKSARLNAATREAAAKQEERRSVA